MLSYTDRLIYLSLPCKILKLIGVIWLKFLKLSITYTIQQYHLIFLATKELTPEAPTIKCKIILFIMTHESIFFSARTVNIWNSLRNSVADACNVNAFKARLVKFWQHQLVRLDFRADLTGTGSRSEKVIKWYCLFMLADNNDADLEVLDTCVRSSLYSWVVELKYRLLMWVTPAPAAAPTTAEASAIPAIWPATDVHTV